MMKNIFIFWVSSLMLAVPQGLSAQSDTTYVAAGNPIVKHKFIADPAAMVHDGKMYIYGGHDECPPPKEHYDLKRVKARTKQTEILYIFFGIHTANVVQLEKKIEQRALFEAA